MRLWNGSVYLGSAVNVLGTKCVVQYGDGFFLTRLTRQDSSNYACLRPSTQDGKNIQVRNDQGRHYVYNGLAY
jgi:hypothetical protein